MHREKLRSSDNGPAGDTLVNSPAPRTGALASAGVGSTGIVVSFLMKRKR